MKIFSLVSLFQHTAVNLVRSFNHLNKQTNP